MDVMVEVELSGLTNQVYTSHAQPVSRLGDALVSSLPFFPLPSFFLFYFILMI